MTRHRPLLDIPDLPCHFGPMPGPDNFAGLPNVMPFALAIDLDVGILRQVPSEDLKAMLDRVYHQGNLLGTPLINDEFGAAYVEDFLDFLDREAIRGRQGLRILEVGAGAGFLSLRLRQAGHVVTAIEPGSFYREYWDRYGIEVLNSFFPTPDAPGPFDLIVSYAVIEHVEDSVGFLRSMASHLAPGGLIAAAVPNDSEEIVAGDPGMLVHEHYIYFMPPALKRLLEAAGLKAGVIEEATHSRVLFSVAEPGRVDPSPIAGEELAIYDAYAASFRRFKESVQAALEENVRAGRSLGIYCPSRALAVLPRDIDARFFDDASYNKGKFFPPFPIRIEDREDLFSKPVDEMWIMSRSFSRVIADRIEPAMRGGLVRTIESFGR